MKEVILLKGADVFAKPANELLEAGGGGVDRLICIYSWHPHSRASIPLVVCGQRSYCREELGDGKKDKKVPCSAQPGSADGSPSQDGDVSGQGVLLNVPEHHQHSLNIKEHKYWNHF